MKRNILKIVKVVFTALLVTVFLPVSSFALPEALAASEYSGTQVSYNFGFFASVLIVISLGILLYFLNSKASAKKQ